jgi:putative ABC transport system permease protein
MVPADILKLFTFEGLVFGLLGSFIGALFAVGISLIVSFLGGIPMPPPPGATQGYNLLFSIDSKGCLLVSALIILVIVKMAMILF